MLCRLPAGAFRVLLLVFASVCAWYSGYLLAELIPDAPLSSAVYNIRSIGEKPVLKGECCGLGQPAWAPQPQPWMRVACPYSCGPNTQPDPRVILGASQGPSSFLKVAFKVLGGREERL